MKKKIEENALLRQMDLKKLRELLLQTRKQQFENRMKISAGQFENMSAVAKDRKKVARIKTIMQQQLANKPVNPS